MNRLEFMTTLAALLQDISVEEREEAMQYYNDYFDDAGIENEMHVVAELESPQKVAATIKAGLSGQCNIAGEYSERGYTDTRFEQKEPLINRGIVHEKEPVKTSNWLKIVLIILIVIVGGPIVLPIAFGILATVGALFLAMIAIFVSFLFAGIAIFIVGIVVAVFGMVQLVSSIPIALGMIGGGMILFAIGMVTTVGMVKLCILVFPAIFKGVVWICRRPFQGKAVKAS
ncbi:MAG: hypothetical protein RR920_05840 [Lachnospiraceae bacterium]